MRELAWKYSPDIRQIDLDVNRTYREHIMFRDRYSSKQQVRTRVYCSADKKRKQNSTDSKKIFLKFDFIGFMKTVLCRSQICPLYDIIHYIQEILGVFK